MKADEKRRKIQKFGGTLKMQIIILGTLAAAVIFLIGESVYKVRSNVKEVVWSSESAELHDIAEKSGYKAGLALENCVRYIDRLEDENSQLSSEKGAFVSDIRGLEAELERVRKEFSILSSGNGAEYQLCSLFTGGGDKRDGAVLRDGLDDTIIYMNYAPKSESDNKWEQYDRLEVDLYKRDGYWSNELNRSISAVLPVDLETGVYRIVIVLRTDASRMSKSGQGDQPAQPANGGSVTLSVGGQNIAAREMRLGSEKAEGEGLVEIHGGEEVTLRINPQNNTNFFSFAVCLEKNMSNLEAGEGHE